MTLPRALAALRPLATFGERHPLLRDALIGGALLLPAFFLTAALMAAVG